MADTRTLHRTFWVWLVAAGLAAMLTATPSPALAETPAQPLPRAHAHNDYLHPRPLYDAVEQGFTSIEANLYPALGSDDLR